MPGPKKLGGSNMSTLITQTIHEVTDVSLNHFMPENGNCVSIKITNDDIEFELALFFGDDHEKVSRLVDALRTLSA